jgi:F-type H+-transporting ATPase subunit b
MNAAAAATTAATTPAPAAGGGLPQFDIAQWPGQVVWLLIIFGIMFALFHRVIVPRLSGGVSAREDKIAADIAEARRLRENAQAEADSAAGEMSAARGRAQRLASEAADQSKAAANESRAAEDAKLDASISAAEQRIAASRAEAMSHVRVIAIDTAKAMVARLTGAEAGTDEIERALAAHAAVNDPAAAAQGTI